MTTQFSGGVGGAPGWEQLRRSLLQMARRSGINSADAEDVAQALLERMMKRQLIKPSGERGAERYHRRICLNAVRSEYRARIRRRRREESWGALAAVVDSPEDMLIDRESGERCFVALSLLADALPGAVVQAFMLCDLQGKTAPYAAATLRVPEGTVRTWLRRARMRLSAILQELDSAEAAPVVAEQRVLAQRSAERQDQPAPLKKCRRQPIRFADLRDARVKIDRGVGGVLPLTGTL